LIGRFSDSQSVNTLDDMRAFLEELYTVTYTEEVSNNIKYTICYKLYVLGTYIPSVLSVIQTISMEDFFSKYGSPPASPLSGSQTPPAPGILTSTQDYMMLLQLYNAGLNIRTICGGGSTDSTFKIWTQDFNGDKVTTHDKCENIDMNTSGIISQAMPLYKVIKTCLEHFHNQTANSQTISHGDNYDTSLHSTEGMSDYYGEYLYRQCNLGNSSGKNICNGVPTPNDFYNVYSSQPYFSIKKNWDI